MIDIIEDPTNEAKAKEAIYEVWEEKFGDENKEYSNKTLRWFFGYDEWGYINKAIYIACITHK